MERIVPFVEIVPSRFQAEHVESLANGLAIIVTAVAYFPEHHVLWPPEEATKSGYARVELSLMVSHFGREVMRRDSGRVTFQPKNPQKKYSERYAIYVGDWKIEPGFSGKAKSRGKYGWLPQYLYVKLLPEIK